MNIRKNKKRILLILRHGKSILKEEEEELSDFDRSLNQQWKNQAVSTGKLIRNIDLVPDYIIAPLQEGLLKRQR